MRCPAHARLARRTDRPRRQAVAGAAVPLAAVGRSSRPARRKWKTVPRSALLPVGSRLPVGRTQPQRPSRRATGPLRALSRVLVRRSPPQAASPWSPSILRSQGDVVRAAWPADRLLKTRTRPGSSRAPAVRASKYGPMEAAPARRRRAPGRPAQSERHSSDVLPFDRSCVAGSDNARQYQLREMGKL